MPTRISAGVGDHPCFLTFPIDCKITYFPYTCLFAFFENAKIISWCALNY